MIYKTTEQTPDLAKAVVQSLQKAVPDSGQPAVDVLRLDLIHPVVSGNKWFKLKYYLQQAVQENKQGIVTLGGAWSNHLVATAFACQQAGLSSIGVIRGEQPAVASTTLQDVQRYNMQLRFVSRAVYANEQSLLQSLAAEFPQYLMVPQGGQGAYGVQGAAEILNLLPDQSYSHIACAVGTGTMMAGIVTAAAPHQQVTGISSLKLANREHNSLQQFVQQQTGQHNFNIFYDYHFGGYARKNDQLVDFMNTIYRQYGIPTDFVYTGKLFYAMMDLLQKNYFPADSRILLIHSGGLQGNRSLKPGQLIY